MQHVVDKKETNQNQLFFNKNIAVFYSLVFFIVSHSKFVTNQLSFGINDHSRSKNYNHI
jgi:hypothetical protein